MRLKRDQSGQALVEMAIVLPVLLLILAGMLDLGRVIYTYTEMHQVAQETVRVAGLGGTDQEVTTFAKSHAEADNLQVTITPDGLTRNSGDYVTVKLDLPFSLMTPIISQLFPSPFSITTESTIRVE
ncbi:pilus assembly protein [Bacillaceae bacterium S4-13-58]